MTATTVKVGILYPEDVGPEANALGISGLVTGDNKAQAQAVVDYLNQHGGFAGHQIDPVYVAINATQNPDNPDLNYQAACASLTQDNSVFAVFTILNTPANFLTCMRQHGVTLLDDAAFADESTYGAIQGFFYTPSDFLDERLYRDEVDALVAQGWLTATTKVGLYSYADPEDQQVIDGAVIPELARFGMRPAAQEAVSNSVSGVSDNSNVTLQFRARGVNRVLPVLASPLFLMEAAQSQHYYPAFAVNSDFGPGALLETAAPASELVGAAGMGWQPLADLDTAHQLPPISANARLCTQVMNQAGQGSSSATTQLLEAQICDVLFFAASALHSTRIISPVSLATGKQGLSGFPSSLTFSVSFPGGRPDGASAFRYLAYRSSCNCFSYTSSNEAA